MTTQDPSVRLVTEESLTSGPANAILAGNYVAKQSLTRFGLGAHVTIGKTHGVDYCTLDYASDDLAVQAAIDDVATGYSNGASVHIAPGQYDFVNPVVVPTTKHNISILGSGMATQIRWKNGNAFADTTPGDNYLFTTNDYCQFGRMQLNGRSTFTCPINGVNTFSAQGTNTLGGGLKVNGARVWVVDLYVTGMAENGIQNDGGIGVKWSNVEVIGCGGIGVHWSTTVNPLVAGVFASDNDVISLWVGSCGVGLKIEVGGLWLPGSHVWGCQGDGIYINADSVRVKGSYPENNAGWGININGRNNCIVTGCDIWANGLGYVFGASFGGVLINAGKFNHVTDNTFRDNRFETILLSSTSFDNIIDGNTGTDSFGYNVGTDAAITHTASGTQPTTTTFIDNNAPAWMASKLGALGMTLAIAGAGVAGASLAVQVVDWVSTTQVTLSAAMSTATTDTTYSVHAMSHGVHETGSSTRNTIINNNMRQAQLGLIEINSVSSRNSRSYGNKAVDEDSWNQAGSAAAGALPGFDLRLGGLYSATLTADVTAITLFAAGTPPRGTKLTVMLTQDATGGHAVSGWPSNFKFAGGSILLSRSASAIDIITFIFDGTNWIEQARRIGDQVERFGRKSADGTAIVSNTTLAVDSDFTIPVYAGEVLAIEGVLNINSSQAADVKVRLDAPSGTTGAWSGIGPAGSSASTTADSYLGANEAAVGTQIVWGTLGVATPVGIPLRGMVVVGTTAGNLTLSFAQQTSDASNTVVLAHSWIKVRRVA